MRKDLLVIVAIMYVAAVNGQEKDQKNITPYIAVYAGGCVDNPFQFALGIQKPLRTHLAIAYDIHYWKTGYECYCDDMHSTGNFRSFTPSVKIIFNTGKKEARGLMAGLGLGYMFARDRGTEQSYRYDESLKTYTHGNLTEGNWDFNSVSPSFSLGIGFRILKLPVSFNSTYYFANTSDGWQPAAGGAGFTIGFSKLP